MPETPKTDWKNLNYRQLLYRRRFLLVGVGSFVGVFCLVVFAILPQVQSIFDGVGHLNAQRQVVSDLRRKVSALEEVQFLQEYQNNPKVNQALPSEKPLLQLLNSTNFVAQQTGVIVTDIGLAPGKISTESGRVKTGTGDAAGTSATSPPPPALAPIQTITGVSGKAGVDAIVTELKVQGTLDQINAFLDGMEKITPIRDVSSIKLASLSVSDSLATPDRKTTQFTAELKITTFFFTKSISVAIDQPLPEIGPTDQQILQQLETFAYPDVSKQDGVQGGGLEDLFKVNNQGVLEE